MEFGSGEKKQAVIVRDATPDDIKYILQLVIDLAEYEKAKESAKATPELLKKNLFGETPYGHTLLAFLPPSHPESGKGPIGIALYFFNFSTWTGRPGLFLEDLCEA